MAVILLIAGFVLAKPFLIMWSIVVSVLSALFLVIGALLRRHELFPGGGQAAVPANPPPPAGLVPPGIPPYTQTGPMGAQPSNRPQPHPRTATVPSPAPGVPTPHRPAAGGISPDAIVLVIPGRKRYHVQGCRQLAGRDHEELTYEEAREEGFTPCTACLPDAALGGRQLPPVDDAAPAESPAESSGPTRVLRPPVVQPKPAAKASTPASEPSAPPAEAGWFARTSQAEDPVTSGRAASPEPSSPAADEDAPKPPTSRPAASSAEQTRPVQERRPSGARASEERPAEKGRDDQEPGRPARDPGKPGGPAEQSGREGEEPRSAQGPGRGAEGAGRSSQEQKRPSASPEPEDDSDPDTRPQPRVTAAGTPVPQRPGKAERGSTPAKPGTSLREDAGESGERTGAAERSGEPDSTRSDQPEPRKLGAPPAAGPSRQDRPGTRDGKPGSGTPSKSRPASGEGKSGGGAPSASSSPERAVSSEGKPGSGGGSSEETVRTRALFEPASPAAGGKRAPFSAPAKAEGPVTKGAAPREKSGQKAEDGRTVPGPKGDGPDAGETKEREPAEAEGGDARRSTTVKVIVGTRRYHAVACPLIKGAGDAGVETMTLGQAEAAGLTACSVCQHDRETVS